MKTRLIPGCFLPVRLVIPVIKRKQYYRQYHSAPAMANRQISRPVLWLMLSKKSAIAGRWV
ncbi:MAG TPA: hypothetical protein VIM87_09130 [Chitinophaga sp.]|uniref:hypothetical protein n=1 Tax=Chitinophaga sp. TaxID=1869181 RepID=UPI002F952896